MVGAMVDGGLAHYRLLPTALGPLRIVSTEVSFVDADDPAPAEATEGGPVVDLAAAQLQAFLTRERRGFDLPLAPEGTAHDQQVWRHLQSIPYGATTTYGEVAHALDNPGAARAVGMASNRNPIAIIVPCHRVVGADGKLTGYAAGTHIKAQLLDLERLGLIPRS